MPNNRRKPTVSSKRYEIDITQTDPADIAKFADTPEGKDSPFFAATDGQGVTVGRSLDYGECEGVGLPDWKTDRQLFVELNLNFVVRVTCDQKGVTYLEIHQAGHQSFYSFQFKGIEYKDLFSIAPNFEQRLSRFLIQKGMYPLFWALYREKETDKDKRCEAYDKITANFEIYFKNILKPKREREIESKESDGLKITSYERIETGREPKTEAEIEQEKRKFISDVFEALKQIESEGGKRTQLDVGTIIFEDKDSEDIQSLMKNRCRKYDLKWQTILNEYKGQKV